MSTSAIVKELGNTTLIAVAKKKTTNDILAVIEHGVSHIGENYLQEAEPKIAELAAHPITWHFIGQLQSNKVKKVVELFDVIQSVDSKKLIDKINAYSEDPMDIMIQLNMGNESQKRGVSLHEAKELTEYAHSRENIRLIGYMVVVPQQNNPKPLFTNAYSFFATMKRTYPSITHLSMGMSSDYKTAIACGATMVRLGTKIFGSR